MWLGKLRNTLGASILILSPVYCLADDPAPRIVANNESNSVNIPSGAMLNIEVSLSAGGFEGKNADWWVVAHTPFEPPNDWYHFNIKNGWTVGLSPTHKGALSDISSPYRVFEAAGLPNGKYVFYFGVDRSMNGSIDEPLNYDLVNVTIEAPPSPELSSLDITGTWQVTTTIGSCGDAEAGVLDVTHEGGWVKAYYSSPMGIEANCSKSGPWGCGGSGYRSDTSILNKSQIQEALNLLLDGCELNAGVKQIKEVTDTRILTQGDYESVPISIKFER